MPAANVINPILPLVNDMKLVLYQKWQAYFKSKPSHMYSLWTAAQIQNIFDSLKYQELNRYIVNVQQICKPNLGKKKY